MHYFKELFKKYNFFEIVFYSIIVAVFLFLLDYYDLPSLLIDKFKIITISVFIILCCLMLKDMVNKKLYKLIIKKVNVIDYLGVLNLLSFNFYTLFSIFVIKSYNKISIGIIIFSTIFLLFRIILIKCNETKEDKSLKYSLYDLYNSSIEEASVVLLDEKALDNAEKDLMDFKLFVDNLEMNITSYNSTETMVIGLIGGWGSGKTTAINMLKQRISNYKDIVMGFFNPWRYDDKISLFKGFFKLICDLSSQEHGYLEYKKLVNKYLSLVSGISIKNASFSLSNAVDSNEESFDDIRDKINTFIASSNKKIIIVIDDIDRLNKEEMLFTFKAVKNLFDFNNIVYILAYDERQIDKIFDQEYKFLPGYIDKIVQTKLHMPILEKREINKIGHVCVKNLFQIHGINIVDETRYKRVTHLIFDNMTNMREVVRFINTLSLSIKLCKRLDLDVCDYMALRYIQFIDTTLYKNLYDNPQGLVSIDGFTKSNNSGMSFFVNGAVNDSTKDKENLINELSANPNMKELLKELFPDFSKQKNISEIPADRRKSIQFRRCCNGRCFYRYFYINEDAHLQMNRVVKTFIEEVNQGENIEQAFEINKIKITEDINLFLELLAVNSSQITNINTTFDFFIKTNNAKYYSIVNLFAALISNEDDEEKIHNYISRIINEKSIVMCSDIIPVIENEWVKNDIAMIIKEDLVKCIKAYIENKIDVFELPNYINGTCKKIYRFYDNKEEIINYFDSIVNKKNVFKILGESIAEWFGYGISYQFNSQTLKLFVTQANVDKVLKGIDKNKLNEDQLKILKLYNEGRGTEEQKITINFENL